MKKRLIFGLLVLFSACSSPGRVESDLAVEKVGDKAGIEQIVVEKTAETTTDQGGMNMEKIALDELGYQMDSFKTASGKDISLHCIRHGSLRIVFDGVEIQVDPVSRMDNRDIDYQKMPKADYVLITHEHYDHWDDAALAALKKADTTVITNKNVAAKVAQSIVMTNGEARDLRSDIRIEAVAAYNTTPGHDKFHPKGRDNGFVLTLDGFRIYIAADTEDIAEMANIRDVDVAFLPCNQPYTMTPAQLAHAVEMVKPKIVFPYHYSDTEPKAMVDALKALSVDVRIRNYQ